jgi:dTDP-4-dehydrorhamnose reductase
VAVMTIVLLGASGYVGSALAKEIDARCIPAFEIARGVVDYTIEENFRSLMRDKPTHVINAAAWIPQPSVDACRNDPAKTWRSNVHFPAMLAKVCNELGIMLCHISTGCLYDEERYYTEDDAPTRWQHDYAGLYVNTKYYGEVLVQRICPNSFVWRVRLPFDEVDHPRNFLTKIQQHAQVWDHRNSLTHRGDFARAAIDMIERGVMPGVYNMTNPVGIHTNSIMAQMEQSWGCIIKRQLVPGPVPGTLLSGEKLKSAGIFMRSGPEAVTDALNRWRKE